MKDKFKLGKKQARNFSERTFQNYKYVLGYNYNRTKSYNYYWIYYSYSPVVIENFWITISDKSSYDFNHI